MSPFKGFVSMYLASFALACFAAVDGRVLDEQGRPVPGISVHLTTPSTRPLEATTDADGRFSIAVAPAGPAQLRIDDATYLPVVKSVDIPASGMVLADVQLVRPLLTERVVVTGVVGDDIKRVPGGTAVVSQDEMERSLGHNLKDVLAFVPGVLAQPRFGADESQVSIRGSGLRNNYHHRGTSLLINGVPYQDADGFGDFESIDLLAMERIEIWKGANALRYGANALGGAINFVTNDGGTSSRWNAIGEGGSYGLGKIQAGAGGPAGPVSYYASASYTGLDGYRDHSAQKRTRVFSNLKWVLSPETAVVADASFANVNEELPGALTRAEFEADPTQADPTDVAQNWGRSYDFGRAAVGLFHRLGPGDDIGVSLYVQRRDMVHPIFEILDQDQRTIGGEFRYERERNGKLVRRLIAGVSVQDGRTNAHQYENIDGSQGALTQDFDAGARNYGAYAEAELTLARSVALILGTRVDRAERSYDDRFLADGDRSDERAYDGISPKIGVLWSPVADTQVFANVSRAVEPPLLLEMTSFGAAGFLPLDAQEALQYEAGGRGRVRRLSWDVSVYYTPLRHEIVNTNVQPFPGAPFTIPSFRNADRTLHAGAEIGADVILLDRGDRGRLSWRTSWTESRFRYDGDAIFANNDLPGAPRHLIRSEVRLQQPRGFWVAPAVDWSPSSYYVDSANTAVNDAYAILNVKGGFDWRSLSLYVQATNVTDKNYAASVVVDDALGRYYEPANARSFYVGLRWRSKDGPE